MYRVIQGDALTVLRGMPNESVQCIITSPPYFALRSYLSADHPDKQVELGSEKLHDCLGWATGQRCGACYICRMSEVFREARRVLRSDGVMFVNVGDSYFSQGGSQVAQTKWQITGASDTQNGGKSRSVGSLREEVEEAEEDAPNTNTEAYNAWAAGFFDGEGNVCICQSGKQKAGGLRISASQVAREPIDRLHYMFGGSVRKVPGKGSWSDHWTWQVSFTKAAAALERMLPYLCVTKEQAELGLKFQSLMLPYGQRSKITEAQTAEREAIKSAISKLNKRGFVQPLATPKAKDLCGIPERLALSLQADGWYWRSKIIWRKPAPMPGSQQDRPTVDFEPVWLFSKSSRYFWDAEAVAEESIHAGYVVRLGEKSLSRASSDGAGVARSGNSNKATVTVKPTRTLRTVWDLPPMPTSDRICRECRRYFPDGRELKQINGKPVCTCGASDWISHYAGFPLELPERCLMAGTSERGCCPACGNPWARVVERIGEGTRKEVDRGFPGDPQFSGGNRWNPVQYAMAGWKPQCSCDAGEPAPCTVADIFHGSGTTGLAALKHGRNYVGIELSADYIDLSLRRTERLYPLLLEATA